MDLINREKKLFVRRKTFNPLYLSRNSKDVDAQKLRRPYKIRGHSLQSSSAIKCSVQMPEENA
jgi:hypothetical protein